LLVVQEYKGGFVEHPLKTQRIVTKYIAMIVIKLVTPKAAAKQKLLFYKPASKVGC